MRKIDRQGVKGQRGDRVQGFKGIPGIHGQPGMPGRMGEVGTPGIFIISSSSIELNRFKYFIYLYFFTRQFHRFGVFNIVS